MNIRRSHWGTLHSPTCAVRPPAISTHPPPSRFLTSALSLSLLDHARSWSQLDVRCLYGELHGCGRYAPCHHLRSHLLSSVSVVEHTRHHCKTNGTEQTILDVSTGCNPNVPSVATSSRPRISANSAWTATPRVRRRWDRRSIRKFSVSWTTLQRLPMGPLPSRKCRGSSTCVMHTTTRSRTAARCVIAREPDSQTGSLVSSAHPARG